MPDGYIDFDKVVEENDVEIKREVRGNANREKDCIEIEGETGLITKNMCKPIPFFESRIANCKKFGEENEIRYPNSEYYFIKDNHYN